MSGTSRGDRRQQTAMTHTPPLGLATRQPKANGMKPENRWNLDGREHWWSLRQLEEPGLRSSTVWPRSKYA
jgi:hypothetical protein